MTAPEAEAERAVDPAVAAAVSDMLRDRTAIAEDDQLVCVASWSSRTAHLYRFRAQPGGPSWVAKVGAGWSGEDAQVAHRAATRLSDALPRHAEDVAFAPGVVGWRASPPLVVTDFVPGEAVSDLVSRLRDRAIIATELPDTLERCGAAIAAYHEVARATASEVDRTDAAIEVARVARRSGRGARAARTALRDVPFVFVYEDIASYNMKLVDGRVCLLDPPHQSVVAPIFRDLAWFLAALDGALAGTARLTRHGARRRVLSGYASRSRLSPDWLAGHWLLPLYEAQRMTGKTRTAVVRRDPATAVRFGRQALGAWLRSLRRR